MEKEAVRFTCPMFYPKDYTEYKHREYLEIEGAIFLLRKEELGTHRWRRRANDAWGKGLWNRCVHSLCFGCRQEVKSSVSRCGIREQEWVGSEQAQEWLKACCWSRYSGRTLNRLVGSSSRRDRMSWFECLLFCYFLSMYYPELFLVSYCLPCISLPCILCHS